MLSGGTWPNAFIAIALPLIAMMLAAVMNERVPERRGLGLGARSNARAPGGIHRYRAREKARFSAGCPQPSARRRAGVGRAKAYGSGRNSVPF